jgi:hypothetical protein
MIRIGPQDGSDVTRTITNCLSAVLKWFLQYREEPLFVLVNVASASRQEAPKCPLCFQRALCCQRFLTELILSAVSFFCLQYVRRTMQANLLIPANPDWMRLRTASLTDWRLATSTERYSGVLMSLGLVRRLSSDPRMSLNSFDPWPKTFQLLVVR